MSLSLLSPLPDQSARIRDLEKQIYEKNRQLNERDQAIRDLNASLSKAEEERDSALVAMGALRSVLLPLHNGLKAVFMEMDAAGVPGSAIPSSQESASPRSSAAWDSWKAKMGGAAAKIIDLLMLHGELNHTQLRIHIGTNRMQTVYDAVSKLNKAGLLNKNGDKFSLKEL